MLEAFCVAKGWKFEIIVIMNKTGTLRFTIISNDIINGFIFSLADLEDLVKVFLSFNRMADLESWLQERLRSNFE